MKVIAICRFQWNGREYQVNDAFTVDEETGNRLVGEGHVKPDVSQDIPAAPEPAATQPSNDVTASESRAADPGKKATVKKKNR